MFQVIGNCWNVCLLQHTVTYYCKSSYDHSLRLCLYRLTLTWCFPPDHCPKCSISSTNSSQAASENMGNQNTSGHGYKKKKKFKLDPRVHSHKSKNSELHRKPWPSTKIVSVPPHLLCLRALNNNPGLPYYRWIWETA